jgi:hypothetical protein
MISDSLRSMSADTVVISIALLGVIFILAALVWRKFTSNLMTLSLYWRRQYLKIVFITFGIPVLIPVSVYTIVGVYYPSLAPSSALLVFMLLSAVAFLYLLFRAGRWVVDRIRRVRKPKEFRRKLDTSVLVSTQCMICLGLSALCSLFALFAAGSSALDIYVGQSEVESFNWSRWILNDAIFLFVIGAFLTAFLYMMDRRSRTD